ncbi:MAG: RNA methyltransferase [Bacteroidota bacterium]|nr:RNA methyltransferase [Bacteroidota bacterium]
MLIDLEIKKKLLTYLSEFITDKRKERIEEVISKRTKHITVILEDIFQAQNASAVLRTCDCLGIQEVHVIENINDYNINPDIALGSDKWLSIHYYNNPEDNIKKCYDHLRAQGYKIIATTPHKNDCTIEELDLTGKTAILYGNEAKGISPQALEYADGYVKIPMVGFTESFNISVSAGISLYHLTCKLRKSEINWHLSEEEITDIKLDWYRNTIKKVELIEEEFLSKHF